MDASALDGEHVYNPESFCDAFCIRRRLVVTGPFSVTRLIPPRGESKLITWALWDQTIVGGGSGVNFTVHVKLIVEPILMNNSGLPMISVIGSAENCRRREKYSLSRSNYKVHLK